MRFKLLGGNHVEPNPDPNAIIGVDGEVGISFNKGDIITTDRDLAKIFGANKFEKIYSDEQLMGGQVIVTESAPIPTLAEVKAVVTKPDPDAEERAAAANKPQVLAEPPIEGAVPPQDTEIPETPEVANTKE